MQLLLMHLPNIIKLVLDTIHVVGDQQPPIFTLVPSMNMAVDDYCGTYLGALNVLLFSSIYIGHIPCSNFCIIIYIEILQHFTSSIILISLICIILSIPIIYILSKPQSCEKIIDYIAFVFPDLLFSLKIASDKAQNKP